MAQNPQTTFVADRFQEIRGVFGVGHHVIHILGCHVWKTLGIRHLFILHTQVSASVGQSRAIAPLRTETQTNEDLYMPDLMIPNNNQYGWPRCNRG